MYMIALFFGHTPLPKELQSYSRSQAKNTKDQDKYLVRDIKLLKNKAESNKENKSISVRQSPLRKLPLKNFHLGFLLILIRADNALYQIEVAKTSGDEYHMRITEPGLWRLRKKSSYFKSHN